MPIYSYFCKDRHETEHRSSASSRPDSIECKTCGLEAGRGFSVSVHHGVAPSSVLNRTYSKSRSGLSLHDFKCRSCDSVFEEIVDHGAGESSTDGKPCPKCATTASPLPGSRIERFWSRTENFPYFDRGLGKWIHSKQQRDDICRNPRAHGINADRLEPVEGDFDPDKETKDYRLEQEQLMSGYNKYADMLQNSPAFASYRKSMEQGKM
jgi:hypothetical protein